MPAENNPFSVFDACCKAVEGGYGAWIQILGIFLVVIVGNFFVKAILYRLYKRYQEKQKLWRLSFVAALHKPLTFYIWLVATVASLDMITSHLFSFHLKNMHIVLSIGAILAFGWFLLRWNSKAVHYGLQMCENNQLSVSASKLDLMGKVATVVIIFVIILLLMDVTGQNMQTLIAFGGIGGLALAIASQQVISNFFGGVMIYLTKPFNIGEWVDLPERKIEGYIEEIGWYLTRIRNFEKRPIYVPNSIFAQSIVVTPSRMSHERFNQMVGLRYSDIGVVKAVVDAIKLMLLRHPHIDQNCKIEVFLLNFGESSLDIKVSAYMSKSTGLDFPGVRQEILLKIASIIEQHGAALASPTQVIEFQGELPFNVPSPT